jgi:CTP synthase
VSYVPYLSHIGESKTKPTQHGVKELRALGLSPDFILCRSEIEVAQSAKQKVALFTNLRESRVFTLHNQESIFYVPELLESQGFSQMACESLGLTWKSPKLGDWIGLARTISSIEASSRVVHIAIVGKYTGLKDSYLSVIKALQHSSYAETSKIELDWIDSESLEDESHANWGVLRAAHGVLIPGGFGLRGIEGKIKAASYARTNNKPYLGICLGLQIAVVEYARNVLNCPEATSQEFNESTPHPYIVFMPEIEQIRKGGTMRLGSRNCLLKDGSLASRVYSNASVISERHRHRYEVNPDKVGELEAAGMVFSGKDIDSVRMEIIELPSHKFYFGTQFHPEFKSKPFSPSPPFHAFVKACVLELE